MDLINEYIEICNILEVIIKNKTADKIANEIANELIVTKHDDINIQLVPCESFQYLTVIVRMC